MKLCMMEAATGIQSPINMNVADDDEGPSLLDIIKDDLANASTAANRAIVKEFTAKYLAIINYALNTPMNKIVTNHQENLYSINQHRL